MPPVLKVIITLALAGAAGAAGWYGWKKWQASKALPVTPTPTPGPTPGPSPSPTPTPTPGPVNPWAPSGGSNAGAPPNASGDAAGYNTQMFPSTPVVNAILAGMPYGGISDMTKPAPASVIKAFQRDFNAVSTAMHSGKIAPSKQFANGATLRGTLSEDGIPGVNTLRALELARLVILTNDDKWAWPNFVAKAKA